MRRHFKRRILLPTFAQISAADSGGEFGTKRNRLPAAVLERIHLLRHHVGRLADAPGEYLSLLDRRHFDALEPEQPAHAIECGDNRREAVGVFSKQALRAPDGLNRRHWPRLSTFRQKAESPLTAAAIAAARTSEAAACRSSLAGTACGRRS